MKAPRWSSSYETGVPDVDEEHRRLFAVVGKISKSLTVGDGAAVVRLIDEFIAEIGHHFAQEEALLAKTHFPGLKAHKVYHRALLQTAERLRSVCSADAISHSAEACHADLIAFLIDDIIRGDSQFISHLEHHGFTRKKL